MEATGEELLELARALGRVVHAGQSRKGSGEPYFNHLERVAGRVTGWRAKTIAYLHDTIEDTPVLYNTLIRAGFPRGLVNDVEALTRFEDTETYFEFIERSIEAGSDDALYVKLADLADNLHDPSGWASESHRARYIKSDVMVRAELLKRGRAVPVYFRCSET